LIFCEDNNRYKMKYIILTSLLALILILILYMENETTKENFKDNSMFSIKSAISDLFKIDIKRISNLQYDIFEGPKTIDLSFSVLPTSDYNEPTTLEMEKTLKIYRGKQFKLVIDDITYNASYSHPGEKVDYKSLYIEPNLDDLVDFINNDIKTGGLNKDHNMDRYYDISGNRHSIIHPKNKY
jgi:hypothetical protein